MHLIHRLTRIMPLIPMVMSMNMAYADCDNCCGSMGGVQYCDSSAGRLVCKNGEYSACYCTQHAVMNLQELEGCCLWQGGVFHIDPFGLVICNNGGVSEICSLKPVQPIIAY